MELKGSPENSGQVRFWSSTDPILQLLLFFSEKSNCSPNAFQKVMTGLLFNSLCKMVG